MLKNCFILLSIVAVSGFSGCQKKTPPAVPQSVEVVVYEARTDEVAESQTFSGFVEADNTVAIVARVPGFIQKKNFDGGESVKAGQVLFEIEPYQYEANVKAAEAALMISRAALVQARADEQRNARLLKSGDVAKAVYDVSKANYDSAEARVLEAEANLRNANLNLGYTKISVPMDGNISDSNFDVGNMVSPESGVLTTLVDADPATVSFGVSDSTMLRIMGDSAGDYDRIKEGVIARLRFENGLRYERVGRLVFIDVLFDKGTSSIKFKTEFPNPDGALIPGQYVAVTLESRVKRSKIVVPTLAIVVGQSGPTAYVVEDGKVAARPLRTGAEIGKMTVVDGGLDIGDKVITEGLGKVRAGTAVRVKAPAPESETPPERKAAE